MDNPPADRQEDMAAELKRLLTHLASVAEKLDQGNGSAARLINDGHQVIAISHRSKVANRGVQALEVRGLLRSDSTVKIADYFRNTYAGAEESGKIIEEKKLIETRGVFRKLQPRDTIQMHIAARQWLSNELMVPAQRKRIVITHHAPSRQSVAPQYQDDPLTPAYASRMESVVQLADLWIHGHMHDSFDYTVGECRVVCNPRGYASKGKRAENEAFCSGFTVQL